MALSVNVNLEAYPQGTPLGIVGVGVVENGGSIDVPPEAEQVYYQVNGYPVEEGMQAQDGMDVTGSAEWTPPPDETQATPPGNGGPPTVTPETTTGTTGTTTVTTEATTPDPATTGGGT